MHRTAQRAGGGGNADVFGISHPLHAKTATHIGVGHPHRIRGQPQHPRQFGLLRPDPLPVHAQMQPVVRPFRKSRARLYRRHDDTVVDHRQRQAVG